MAALEIFEKYPDSYRVDHPDFQDVHRTTYARGVIQGFQEISGDPIIVQSLVKVSGEGFAGAEFVPLFYHPKKQYWDPNSQVMGDNYFEKAWMSFRVGDEVVVMLKEGIPIAVLGFADGKPRIGEDVLKSDFKTKHWWRCSLTEAYADKDIGPDGMPLNLLTRCERLTAKSATNIHKGLSYQSSYDQYGVIIVDEERTAEDGGKYILITNYWVTESTRKTTVLNSLVNVYRYLVVIGPILYIIEQESYSFKYSYENNVSETDSRSWNYYQNARFNIYGLIPNPDTYNGLPMILQYNPAQAAAAQAWRDYVTAHHEQDFPVPNLPKDVFKNEIKVYAAIYTKDLYDRAKGADLPGEFVEQEGFEAIMQNDLANDLSGAEQPDLMFYVKAVLQGANNG